VEEQKRSLEIAADDRKIYCRAWERWGIRRPPTSEIHLIQKDCLWQHTSDQGKLPTMIYKSPSTGSAPQGMLPTML
jgi:hypothetical protein